MASRIVVLNAGIVEQIGAPLELYHHPTNRFVAGFIGSPKMNFLPGTLIAAEDGTARVQLLDGSEAQVAVDARRASKGAEVVLGIRPEHVHHITGTADRSPASATATPELSRIRGEVALVENLGESALVYVKIPKVDGLTLCRNEGTSLAKEGDLIELAFPASDAHLFDASGVAFPRTVGSLPGVSERKAS